MDPWLFVYVGIVGWQLHPRNDKEIDLEEAARLTDKIMEIYICRGLQQQLH